MNMQVVEKAKSDKKYKDVHEINSRFSRKLIRGLTVCLKSGFKQNSDIYDLLKNRGFLDKGGGAIVTSRTVNKYLESVRRRAGFARKTKATIICEMFCEGKKIREIAESLSSTYRYVYQTLKNHGHEVKGHWKS